MPRLRIGENVFLRRLRRGVNAVTAHPTIEVFDPAVENLDPVTDMVVERLLFEAFAFDPLNSLVNQCL